MRQYAHATMSSPVMVEKAEAEKAEAEKAVED